MQKINYLDFPTKDRDIKKFLKKQIYRNLNFLENVYDGKIDTISLRGKEAKNYLYNVIGLLEIAEKDWFMRLNAFPIKIDIASKVIGLKENLKVISQIKSNEQIKGWENDKPQFNDLLTLDIDRKTGMPIYGELRGLLDHIKECQTFDKDNINKIFSDWLKNPKKMDLTDYVKLLSLSNKRVLSEIDVERIHDMNDMDTKIDLNSHSAEVIINNYQYNVGNFFEFISLSIFSSNVIGKKGFFEKDKPVLIKKKKKRIEAHLDPKFESIFKNMIINDSRFFHKQISAFLANEYELAHDPKFAVRIISFGIKTPYNDLDKDLFPELPYDYKEEDYVLVIRYQHYSGEDTKEKVKYTIIK